MLLISIGNIDKFKFKVQIHVTNNRYRFCIYEQTEQKNVSRDNHTLFKQQNLNHIILCAIYI